MASVTASSISFSSFSSSLKKNQVFFLVDSCCIIIIFCLFVFVIKDLILGNVFLSLLNFLVVNLKSYYLWFIDPYDLSSWFLKFLCFVFMKTWFSEMGCVIFMLMDLGYKSFRYNYSLCHFLILCSWCMNLCDLIILLWEIWCSMMAQGLSILD